MRPTKSNGTTEDWSMRDRQYRDALRQFAMPDRHVQEEFAEEEPPVFPKKEG